MGSTYLIHIGKTCSARLNAALAPVAIGLALTLVHLIGIPVTNLAVNPSRSRAPALFVGGWAMAQLWLFWLAPMIGALAAGLIYPAIAGEKSEHEGLDNVHLSEDLQK